MQFEHPLTVKVVVTDDAQLRAVYAVLANPGIADALLLKNFWQTAPGNVGEPARQVTVGDETGTNWKSADPTDATEFPDEVDNTATNTAELDSSGAPFDESMHTGTKTKDGLWRMKKGVERPTVAAAAPQPEETSQSADDAGEASANDAEASSDDEDEFAAFRTADAEPAAPVEPLARTWTDADLGALCNQAAQKIGSTRVGEIKATIAEFMPADVVPHSRHVPPDRREEFAHAIEALAEIEFAG